MKKSINTNVILFLGNKWFGTDCRMIMDAFRRKGYAVIEVDPYDYFPLRWDGLILKIIRRIFKPFMLDNYNKAVLAFNNKDISFVVTNKGVMLQDTTIEKFKNKGTPVYCIYPDVSFTNQPPEIEKAIKSYNCIFTTKSFHLNDDFVKKNINNIQLVRHGYDPNVNRPLNLNLGIDSSYKCDISFVGAWSRKKDEVMTILANKFPYEKIMIWGPGWERGSKTVLELWQGRAARGDELNIVYISSKINMGILSEAVDNTGHGDLVTTRTWMIPSTGSFILHEKTHELAEYFLLDDEMAVYNDYEDLINKVSYYLGHDDQRLAIAKKTYQRCVESGYTYDYTVSTIVKYHKDFS